MIKAKNGELTFPLRTEYQNRRVYEEAVSGFFTLEKYREMYDDPLKYFLDETRSTDLVSGPLISPGTKSADLKEEAET